MTKEEILDLHATGRISSEDMEKMLYLDACRENEDRTVRTLRDLLNREGLNYETRRIAFEYTRELCRSILNMLSIHPGQLERPEPCPHKRRASYCHECNPSIRMI